MVMYTGGFRRYAGTSWECMEGGEQKWEATHAVW